MIKHDQLHAEYKFVYIIYVCVLDLYLGIWIYNHIHMHAYI